MFVAAIPLALQLGAGYGVGTDFGSNTHPGIPIRVGVDGQVSEGFSLSLSLLDVPGSKPAQTSCASPCPGNGSFAAISGLATMRWTLETFFVEGGAGIGHLITLSSGDLFQNPVLHGRGSFSWVFGGGAKIDLGDHADVGIEALLTGWNGVAQDAFNNGTTQVQAQADISVVGAFVMVTLWLRP
jgi:hypothetical protein